MHAVLGSVQSGQGGDMSFTISGQHCDPEKFKAPHNVEFTFGGRTLGGGSATVNVVYEADYPNCQVDGKPSVAFHETLTETEMIVARTLTVSGLVGVWPVKIIVTDSVTGFSNELVCWLNLE
jgi:hypothetical protein